MLYIDENKIKKIYEFLISNLFAHRKIVLFKNIFLLRKRKLLDKLYNNNMQTWSLYETLICTWIYIPCGWKIRVKFKTERPVPRITVSKLLHRGVHNLCKCFRRDQRRTTKSGGKKSRPRRSQFARNSSVSGYTLRLKSIQSLV